MSLRSVGNQLLQTTPTVLLDGASTASTSFFICVNTSNDVVAAGGVEVFGDAGGVFSAALSGAGLLKLQWTATGRVTSTCSVGLVPGTAYHVASTWQSGSQQYYLNGVTIASDTQIGTLAPLAKSVPRPFRLGSDQAGADVTLSRPTLWVGYVLTSTDVVNLRGGLSQPGSIASSSVALEWSLDGTNGVAAAVGDAGLTDASTHGLALTTIVGSAPMYLAGDLTYQAGPAYGTVVAAPSNESIVLIAQDSEGNPLGISSIQPVVATQSIRLSGRPVNNEIALTFNGSTTAPIATTTSPPAIYFLWTFPTTAGNSYAISVTWWSDFYSSGGPTNCYFETLDGDATLATYLSPFSPDPNLFVAPEVPVSNGYALNWVPVTSQQQGVIASGSSLSVRMSSTENWMYMSGLRVVDLTTGAISHFDLTDQANFSIVPPSGTWNRQTNGNYYGELLASAVGATSGPTTVFTPQGDSDSPTVLQSALESLGSIGEGNVSVTYQAATGTYQVGLLNALADSPQPAISSADPAYNVSIVTPGGQGFRLNHADGTSLLLLDVVWSESGTCPYILLPLPQSKPEVQTWPVRDLPCSDPYLWDAHTDYSLTSSVSKDPVYGWTAGLTLSFPAQRLPIGTYQWAITWPTQSFSYSDYPGGAVLAAAPSTATQFLVQDGSGNTLATYTVDQTQAPSGYTDANGTAWHVLGSFDVAARDATLTLVMTTVGQSAAASGQVQPAAILDAVQFIRTSPDTSIVISPGDSLSIPAGFAATASGALPTLVEMPINRASPTAIMPAFQEEPKSMKLGWGGVGPAFYYSDFPTFSNLAYLIPTMGTAQDANFYPTRFNYSFGRYESFIIGTNGGHDDAKPFQGTTFTPAGRYILAWDGQDAVSLVPYNDGATTVTPISSPTPIGAPAGNWQLYDVSFDPNLANSPRLLLRLESSIQDPTDPSGQTYEVTLSNLSIYPPDPADPTGQTAYGLSSDGSTWTKPPKFWPHYIAKFAGANCLRSMDVMSLNTQPVGEFAHFKADTHATRATPAAWTNLANGQSGFPAAVASIRGATAAESPALPSYGAVVVIETTAPHHYYDGSYFNFVGCGEANFSETYNNTGPTTVLLDTSTTGLSGIVIGVIDATHLLVVIRFGYGAMTNTTTGGTLLGMSFGTYWSLADFTDLARAIPTVSRLHFNVPLTIDTSPGGALDQLAAWCVANLPPQIAELTIEPGNEVWNGLFTVNFWASAKSIIECGGSPTGYVTPTSHIPFYARQGKIFHDAFDAAFTAAGRPGIVRRLFGAFAGYPQTTIDLASECQSIGAAIDEVCVAFYINPGPAAGYDADQLPIFDRMTNGQILDYGELNAMYGGWPEYFLADQFAALRSGGFPLTKVVGYEGSMSCMVPVDPISSLAAPPGNTPDYALRMHAARRDPRMYGIMLRHIQGLQDAGASAWCYFFLGGEASLYPWATFESDTQPFGTGESVGTFGPFDLNTVPNQIAGGLRTWANLVPAPTIPANPIKPLVLRNGWLATTGRFKGVARPTRFR